MNILMVLSTNTFPPDRRVEREAQRLIQEGHRVVLMARRAPGQPRTEEWEGIRVLRVALPFQRLRPLADLVYYGLQRYWMLVPILLACRRYEIDAIHCHDLPYAFASALASRMSGAPLVLDLHEHYTAMLETAFSSPPYDALPRLLRPFATALLALLAAEERRACRRAHRVIVVAREHGPRIEGLGVPAQRIVEITNTEDPDFFEGLAIDASLMEAYRNRFVVLYVGRFDAERGLETALRAVPLAQQAIPDLCLLLVGDGPGRSSLDALARELGLGDAVAFVDFQPFANLPSFVRGCDVFLIPHVSTPLVEATMPNKIFQAMTLACPVLVSSTGPMMRVVDDAGCGLVFEERNPRSLADQLVALRDPLLRRELGERGRRAVEDRYHWGRTVEPLLAIYRELPAARASQPTHARAAGI